MNDKTYIRILEEYIYSNGHTKADLMAFIINHINQPTFSSDSCAIYKRRTRKFKR